MLLPVVNSEKGGDPVTKTLAMFAMALGIVAITAGSAFAGPGCGSFTTQTVSLETQTASTGSTGGEAPLVPIPEDSAN